jgi:hypothetical protein
MSNALQRAVDVFLAPATDAPAEAAPRPAPPAPPDVAVLGGEPDALAVAAAVALHLRAVARARAACVALWEGREGNHQAGEHRERPETSDTGLAGIAARRMAQQLRAQGHDARARGRLAWTILPADRAQAAAAWQRLTAAAPGPVVLAALGPRGSALDDVLAEHDHVLLVAHEGTEPALLELAVASVEALGPAVGVVGAPPAGRRLVALAGISGVGVAGSTKGGLLTCPAA